MASTVAPAASHAPQLDDIRALVDERARYEGWMQALDARRGSTPEHVLDRVRGDYQARLRQVLDRLASHVDALRDAESGLSIRHAGAQRSLAEQRDALAEVELRTLVGEYDEGEGERLRADAAGMLELLEQELSQSVTELDEMRALIARVTAPSAHAPAQMPQHSPTQTEAAAAPAAAASRAAADASSASASPVPAPQTAASDSSSADSSSADSSSAARSNAVQDAFEAPTSVPASDPLTDARIALGDRDVQGSPEHFAPPLREAAGFPASMSQTDASPSWGAPATPGASQEKTLRCQECGAMNYPTEWYCERCSGELAVM